MATEGPLIHDGSQTTAAADLSAKQFFCVSISAPRAVNLITATSGTVPMYGILQNNPTSGLAADVGILGISKAVIGAAVTAGDYLMVDNTGRLITVVTTGKRVAQALETGAVAGQLITVAIGPNSGNTVA
jgi:hypothetical protein